MSVVDEVKSRLDIVDYIGRSVPLRRAGRTYKAPCPFHAERTPSFVVNPDTQTWRCFGACAEGGDIFSFAMKRSGWSFSEALAELGKLAGVEVHPQTPEQATRTEALERLRGLMTAIAEVYHQKLFDSGDPQAVATLNYARAKRGLTDETLRKFGVGFAPPGWSFALDYLRQLGYSEDDILEAGVASKNEESGRIYDRFRNRLMIPIRDERGRVIGFGARALDPDDNPKYLNSPQTPLFDKSRTLFGLDMARAAIRESETAVIVEGYMDAIQAHQAGYTNVVAQMGTAMTEPQLKQLAPRWAKRIIMALDADAAGQNATLRGLEVARQALQEDFGGRLAVDIRILAIPDAKDPDDLIRENPARWGTLVDNAAPVADYVIAVETAALPPNASLQEREALARRVLPMLTASENDLYRKDSIQKLALRLHIMERDLLMWADEQRRIANARPPRSAPDRRFNQSSPDPRDPLALDDNEPPSEELDVSPSPARVAPDIALEAYCLRMLLLQPELYYHVRRRFREISADNAALLNGPFDELGGEDFSRGDYRILMETFRDSLRQDEMESLDYVRAHLEPAMLGVLERLLVEEVDGLRERISHRMPADLTASFKLSNRFAPPVDPAVEMTDKALRLRMARLQRERQELHFLQMEANERDDIESVLMYNAQVSLSGLAKHTIETELQRQVGLLR